MKTRHGWLLAAALAGLAAHGGALRNGFAWDDHVLVRGNPFLDDPAAGARLLTREFWAGGLRVQGGARPLFVATLAADRAAWGWEPAGWHATSLLLHAAAAAAAGAAAAALGASIPAALGAALLFAVHPAGTEAVQSISFRADVLAALFVFLGLIAWRRALDAGRPAARAAWTGAAMGALALGLLSKESAAALVPLAGALAVSRGGALARRELLAAAAAALLVAGGYFLFRQPRTGYHALDAIDASAPGDSALTPSPPEWAPEYRTLRGRALISAAAFAQHARLIAWPRHLAADRAPRVPAGWSDPWALAGAALPALLLAAAWALRRRAPAAALGLAWVPLALLPVSGLAALYNPVAERYLYLPLFGACLAAACLLEAAAGSPRAFFAVLAAVAAPAAALTAARARDWRDDAALFRDAHLPIYGARALYNRALVRQREGDPAGAEADYRAALQRHPRAVEPMVNLAALAAAAGRDEEAERLLRRAAAARPPGLMVARALGRLLLRQGRDREAEFWLALAARRAPENAAAAADWAGVLSKLGRREEAEAALRRALALNPSLEEARRRLSDLLAGRGRSSEAARLLRAAPREPSAAEASDLGVIEDRAGRLREALLSFDRAVRLEPRSAGHLVNRATILARLGDADGALRDLERAVVLAPADARAWEELGIARQSRGERAAAHDAYRRALSLDPSRERAWTNLGGLLLGLGRGQEAVAALARAAGLAPRDPVVLVAYARALRGTGRADQACSPLLAAARKASQDGGDPALLRRLDEELRLPCPGRGGALLDARDAVRSALSPLPFPLPAESEQVRRARRTLAEQPRSLAARAELSGALERFNDLEGAARELEAAADGRPGRPADVLLEVRAAAPEGRRPYYAAVLLLLRSGGRDEAEGFIRRAGEPGAPQGLMRLQALLRLDGRAADARSVCLRVGRIKPDDAFWRVALADLHMSLGQREEAARDVEGVLARNPGHPIALRLRAELNRARGDGEGYCRDLRAAAPALEGGQYMFYRWSLSPASPAACPGRAPR